MTHHEEESSWDSLASELGLEPGPAPALPSSPPPPPALREPAAAREYKPARTSKPVEVVEETVEEFGAFLASPAVSNGPELEVAQAEEVEDAADVLDDEAPESAEGATEEPTEGEGKGRRRRRRRRRKKGGAAEAASATDETEVMEGEAPSAVETEGEEPDANEPTVLDEESDDVESEPDGQDEVEEIVPEVPLAEEVEDDSTEPLPEWKVTAWTELVATLYRPQDR